MKLLSKSEIDQAKSKDRQREVSEGLKIARRVDSLREVHAQEEASLAQFRQKSIALIQAEITTESLKLGSLKGEVKELEERKVQALQPVSELKEKLGTREVWLQEYERSLNILKSSLDLKESDIEGKRKDIKNLEEKIERARVRQNELLLEADNLKRGAKNILDEYQTKVAQVERLRRNTEERLNNREISISNRESSQKIKDKNQDKRERELNERETRIHDREQTFIRTQKR